MTMADEDPKDFRRSFRDVRPKVMDLEQRVVRYRASDETEDRAGDIIRLAGWKFENFMKNPAIPWAHNYRELPIGRGVTFGVKSGGDDPHLWVDVKFAGEEQSHPNAEQIFKMVVDGFLPACSVGFRPSKWKIRRAEPDEDGYARFLGFEFLEQELLELSPCTIGCNPNALVENAHKYVGSSEDGAFLQRVIELAKHQEEYAQSFMKGELPPQLAARLGGDRGQSRPYEVRTTPDHPESDVTNEELTKRIEELTKAVTKLAEPNAPVEPEPLTAEALKAQLAALEKRLKEYTDEAVADAVAATPDPSSAHQDAPPKSEASAEGTQQPAPTGESEKSLADFDIDAIFAASRKRFESQRQGAVDEGGAP